MNTFRKALLGAFFLACSLALMPHAAEAQGVTRVCIQSIGANGSNNCVDISPANPLPVSGGGTSASPSTVVVSGSAATPVTDCGGSITTGGTAQLAISSAQYLHGFLLEVGANDSNTDPIYFSDTTTTPGAGVAGSLSLNPSAATSAGGSFSSPLNYPVGSNIYINGATTNDKFKCRVW